MKLFPFPVLMSALIIFSIWIIFTPSETQMARSETYVATENTWVIQKLKPFQQYIYHI